MAQDFTEIISSPLELQKYVDLVGHPGAGAIATFVGVTRDTFQGKTVVRLEYEAYQGMAERKMQEVCVSARSKWPLCKVSIAHRLGLVPVGEASVIVAVSSVHRKEALEACTFLIDELKALVPIWKKEVYEGETSSWKENNEFTATHLPPSGSAVSSG